MRKHRFLFVLFGLVVSCLVVGVVSASVVASAQAAVVALKSIGDCPFCSKKLAEIKECASHGHDIAVAPTLIDDGHLPLFRAGD